MSRRGTARFTLRHELPTTDTAAAGAADRDRRPSRRYVPRRFTVTPWQLADVAEPARLRRTVRPTAAGLAAARVGVPAAADRDGDPRPGAPRTAGPMRWARIEGTTPTSDAGWAHADERGEFVLPILDAGARPVPGSPPTRSPCDAPGGRHPEEPLQPLIHRGPDS